MTERTRRIVSGLIGGLIATAPMSLAMRALHRRLPWPQRYPLPPRQIARKVSNEVGLWRRLGPREKSALTMGGHYAYGAACGALFGLLRPLLPRAVGGPAFGLAVWVASYLGWLPALDVLPSATKHPPQRNRLMILAHLVWGISIHMLQGPIKSRLFAGKRGGKSR